MPILISKLTPAEVFLPKAKKSYLTRPLTPKVVLNNGRPMPLIGFGTYMPDTGVFEALKCAIQCGYRHIDCALKYQNEAEIGEAIREKIEDGTVTRKDLFVTTKVWNTYHRREKVMESCKKSLKDLQLDYVDLLLIHWPVAYKEGGELNPVDENGKMMTVDIDFLETWKGMEDCYEKGFAKAIGISNFNSLQVQRILDACKIKPAVLQVECHPYLNQNKMIEFCRKNGIAVTAFSPLGAPSRPWRNSEEPIVMEDERIKKLALKYNKNPAQILLRFNTQRGVAVIPKSATKARIMSNLNVFDFELTDDEMSTLANFKESYRYCHVNKVKFDVNYPFNVEF